MIIIMDLLLNPDSKGCHIKLESMLAPQFTLLCSPAEIAPRHKHYVLCVCVCVCVCVCLCVCVITYLHNVTHISRLITDTTGGNSSAISFPKSKSQLLIPCAKFSPTVCAD